MFTQGIFNTEFVQFMQYLNPMFALLLTFVALLSVRATFWIVPAAPRVLRFSAIDGLRGYLAFFVFIHHAAVWFAYCKNGVWGAPDSRLYTYLGQASVAFFFMITSFLFYDQLLRRKFDSAKWKEFFIGRVFRLAPLYAVLIAVILVIVAILSNGNFYDTPKYVFICVLRWLSFTILGSPDINQVHTFKIVAGATWSLPYEWCFYLMLPLVALTTGQRPAWFILAIAIAGLTLAYKTGMQLSIGRMFIGGLIAARLARNERFARFAKTTKASCVVSSCMILMLLFPTAYDFGPFVLITVAFSLIAGGANLFGLLELSTSRRFGELAYSIYLLHGTVLFSFIHFFSGEQTIATMSASEYWITVATLIPVLLTLSSITFNYIEAPGINLGKKIIAQFVRRMQPMHGIPATEKES